MSSSGRVVSHDQAVAAAEQMFASNRTLDMDVLAATLAVSRATLYRVAGSTERLLGDVLWRQGSRVMARLGTQTDLVGAERFLWLADQFDYGLVSYEPMRRLLRDEPVLAFRVLFMPEARVHLRFVKLWRDLFAAAEQAGEITLPFLVEDFAYVWVRIGESMLYADLLAGREPKFELSRRVQRLLLAGGLERPA